MMKNFKISIVILAVLAVSCTKENGRNGQDSYLMTFQPSAASLSTRSENSIESGIVQGNVFPTDKYFAMNLFRLNFDESGQPIMATGHIFMNMEKISYDSEDCRWQPSSPHYWPLSGGLYGLGFYPAPDSLVKYNMLDSMKGKYDGNLFFYGYQIKHTDSSDNPITDDSQKTDSNLTHARVDFMTALTTVDDVQKRSSNTVPIEFVHALSQLHFTFETDKDYSYYKYNHTDTAGVAWYWTHWQQYWIDEIKITNVYSEGTYSFQAPHWPSQYLKDLYTYYPLRREQNGGTQALYKVGESGTPGDNISDMASFGTRTPYSTPISLDGTNALCLLFIPQLISDNAEIQLTITSRTMNMLSAGSQTVGNHLMNDVTTSYTKTFKLNELFKYFVAGTSVNIKFLASLEEIVCVADYSDWQESQSTEFVI